MEAKKLIIVAMVGVAVGATATWFLRPPGEEKVHVTDIVYKNDAKMSTISVYFKHETIKDRKTSRTKITKPDGTVIEHQDDHVREEEKTETGKTDTQIVVKTEYVEKEIIKEIKTEAPRFSAGMDLNYNFRDMTTVYGAQVEYRVFGPVHLYLRGDSELVFGGGAKLDLF